MSLESGRDEIYVQPFLNPGTRRLVSTEGGTDPVWARNGRELFYLQGDRMMGVDVATRPTFNAGTPRTLFKRQFYNGGMRTTYDVSPDGQRFLGVQPVEPEKPITQINVVINWFEELKRLAPAK